MSQTPAARDVRPYFVHLQGWRARAFERLWTWAGRAVAWTVLMTSFAASCLAWFGLHALVRRWIPLPEELAHPMVMIAVLLLLAVLNIERLQRALDGLSRVIDAWIPTLITLSEGEFALGRHGQSGVDLRSPGVYLLRGGVELGFKGTQDEYDHFDPMSQ